MIATEKMSCVPRNINPRTMKFLTAAIVMVLSLTAHVDGLAVGLSDGSGNKDINHVNTKAPFESQHALYPSAAVTSDTNICSQIGSDTMEVRHGSAVDAAIATMLCVGIVNMQSCGIGGGFVATIYEKPRGQKEKVIVSLLARERAPQAATQDMYVNGSASSTIGGKAVGVPGEIRGYYEAWNIFGRLQWKDLFQSVIKLCEEGFYVEKELSNHIKSNEVFIRSDPNFSELLVKVDGTLVQEGDLLINRKLGTTMRRIADDPLAYYDGKLAEEIIEDLTDYGGIITLEDLQNYRSSFKQTVNVTIQNGGYMFYNPPPPTSGALLDFILNILDGFNLTSANISDDSSRILTYHRIVESFKFAYAKRSNLGDADFVDVTELVRDLTSDEYAEEIRRQIDDQVTHDVDYYGPTFDIKPDSGTAHMNVRAPDGAAVAMTSTINLIFGAQSRGSRTGILFNNQMDDFSTPGTYNAFGVPASPTNYIEPGKMPMSSMCPTLVFDETKSVVYISGASGGTRITTATAFVAANALWFDLDLKTATDEARVHHQLVPNEIGDEIWFDPIIADGLKLKNHAMVQSTTKAVVGSIRQKCFKVPLRGRRLPKCYIEAVSDGRKGGKPAGF